MYISYTHTQSISRNLSFYTTGTSKHLFRLKRGFDGFNDLHKLRTYPNVFTVFFENTINCFVHLYILIKLSWLTAFWQFHFFSHFYNFLNRFLKLCPHRLGLKHPQRTYIYHGSRMQYMLEEKRYRIIYTIECHTLRKRTVNCLLSVI